jgi:glycine/D-amino acid oxidase-like deaminating enzyme
MSYGADKIYTHWSMRSLELWTDLFNQANEPNLFHKTGVLWTCPAGDQRMQQNQASLTAAGVPFESLSHAGVEKRFPQFRFTHQITAVFEPGSGAILARRAVQRVVREAERVGVEFVQHLAGPPPLPVNAAEIVYACGSWLPKIFPNLLTGRIRATRQEVFFFGTAAEDRRFAPPAMPVWLDYTDPRAAYSIPDLEARGFKLAFDQHGPEIDPDTQERVIGAQSVEAARAFLRERFPDLANAPLIESRVCQYENTSNGDFLIDRHPDYENVWIAGGGSGHGFKHGPAVGEYVAKLLSRTIDPEPRFALSNKSVGRARAVY